jgi:hypothetical protein
MIPLNGTRTAALLCNAIVGRDGPTGLGMPNGTGAFCCPRCPFS